MTPYLNLTPFKDSDMCPRWQYKTDCIGTYAYGSQNDNCILAKWVNCALSKLNMQVLSKNS